jgi:hypothetical protein
VVVKLPDEIDELDGYDAEKVQERKEVRMLPFCVSFFLFLILMIHRHKTGGRVCEAAK